MCPPVKLCNFRRKWRAAVARELCWYSGGRRTSSQPRANMALVRLVGECHPTRIPHHRGTATAAPRPDWAVPRHNRITEVPDLEMGEADLVADGRLNNIWAEEARVKPMVLNTQSPLRLVHTIARGVGVVFFGGVSSIYRVTKSRHNHIAMSYSFVFN
jgi:hypothetical protein